MKTGKDLVALATEIERRAGAKQDFIAPVDKVEMSTWLADEEGHEEAALRLPDPKNSSITLLFPLTTLAHTQLAEYLDIPTAYYKRMLSEEPQLLARNVNTWLPEKRLKARGSGGDNQKADQRLLRTLDGKVRAVLSPGYRRLENEDLAEAILPVLADLNLMLLSAEITDRRLYIKAIDRAVQRSIPVGHKMGDGTHTIFRTDTVCPIIVVSNSEVGEGALSIEGGVFTSGCTNLAIFDAKMRKYHTGTRAELTDEVYALLTDETKRKTDEAVWSQTRDLVKAAFDVARFEADVKKLTEAAAQPLEGDPVQVVARVAKRFAFTESTRTGVLRRLIEGGDLSRYGLHSAVTRHSADEADYDEATNLERVGGKIIELPRNDWQALLEDRKAA